MTLEFDDIASEKARRLAQRGSALRIIFLAWLRELRSSQAGFSSSFWRVGFGVIATFDVFAPRFARMPRALD